MRCLCVCGNLAFLAACVVILLDQSFIIGLLENEFIGCSRKQAPEIIYDLLHDAREYKKWLLLVAYRVSR